jgi:hypothetical protein
VSVLTRWQYPFLSAASVVTRLVGSGQPSTSTTRVSGLSLNVQEALRGDLPRQLRVVIVNLAAAR